MTAIEMLGFHATLFASSLAVSSATAGFLLLLGSTVLPNRAKHALGLGWADTFMAGVAAWILLTWFGFQFQVSLIWTVCGALGVSLVVLALRAGHRLRRRALLPRPGRTVLELASVWVLLSGLAYAVLARYLTPENFPFVYSSNLDIFFYASSSQLMIDVGTVNPVRISNFPLGVNVPLNVIGDMSLISLMQVLTSQTPFAFVMPSLMFVEAVLGSLVYWTSRRFLRLNRLVSATLSVLFVSNPLLYYIAYNYFHSQLLASIVILYALYSSLEPRIARQNLFASWFVAGVAYVILFFAYPGALTSFFVFHVLLITIAGIVHAIPARPAAVVRGVAITVLQKLAVLPFLALVFVVVFPDRVQIDLYWITTYSAKNIAGWPQPLVTAMPLLGHLVQSDPVFRLDRWTVAAYAVTLVGSVAGLLAIVRRHSANCEPRIVAGVMCLLMYLEYLALYGLYGESYQQWKFASLFPLLLAFIIPGIFLSGLSRLDEIPQLSRRAARAFASLVPVALVVATVPVNLSAAWAFPITTVPRAWGNMAAIETTARVPRVFVDVDRPDETMAAAYIIRRTDLLLGTEAYYPAADAATFTPTPDFPLLTDKESCVRAAPGNSAVALGGGFYLIDGLGGTRGTPNLDLDLRQAICKPLVAMRNVGGVEGFGRWTTGSRAEFIIRSIPDVCCDLSIHVGAVPFLVPGRLDHQRISLSVNNTMVGEWDLTTAAKVTMQSRIPRSALAGADAIHLVFDLPDAVSPAAIGIGSDTRILGVGIDTIRFTAER